MTPTQIATYKAALKEARSSFDHAKQRLTEITFESHKLSDEIGRLRRTITALAAMCSESPGFDRLGITDACMEVMEIQRGTVTTTDVVAHLENMGFDLATQKNAPASVHAILTRLAKSGKITKITDEKTEAVSWRGPNYDAKFDEDVPF